MPTATMLHRVSPILEQETETKRLPYAPEPWILRECLETGLVYLENPPAYEAFVEDFAWETTKALEAERRAADEPLFYAVRLRFKQLRVSMLNRNKVVDLARECIVRMPNRALLIVEPGCGNAVNLIRLMKELPANVRSRCFTVGIELSKRLSEESARSLAAFGGHCIPSDALSGLAQFEPHTIDLLIFACFLEHEVNPLPLLRRSREVLRDDGKLIIKVPNYDSLARHVRGHRWCGFRWPDHVNYFTPATLRLLIETAGFKVARMNWSDQNPISDNMYMVVEPA
jgi:SAM-dependent methyltransferase